jgi:tRNA(Leu) C34 or U34 (ribose-2'-O)-methylase TrmL
VNAAVLLINPKTPFNVGTTIRACSIFGVDKLRWTGERVMDRNDLKSVISCSKVVSAKKYRLPREERMKDYVGVSWERTHEELAMNEFIRDGYKPVCVEIVDGSIPLDLFEHPDKALYVFGPEDGDVPKGYRHSCHSFVHIPSATRTPLNLASAVNIVLYDRFAKGDR